MRHSGLLVLGSAAILSFALESPRLLIHGLLFVGAGFASVALSGLDRLCFPGTFSFGLAALAGLAPGLALFARFLRSIRPSIAGKIKE